MSKQPEQEQVIMNGGFFWVSEKKCGIPKYSQG